LKHLSPSQLSYITGRSFFPSLIEQPFADGMHLAFTFAGAATIIAVVASILRGERYLHKMATPEPLTEELAEGAAEAGALVGLNETAEIAESTTVPSGNGNGHLNGNGAAARHRPGRGASTPNA
jgi:hypothetical protein